MINLLKEALLIVSKSYDKNNPEILPKVDLKTINQLWQKNNTLSIESIEQLNTFSKILLLSGILGSKPLTTSRSSKPQITIEKLKEKYREICGIIGLEGVCEKSFNQSLNTLKDGGFIISEKNKTYFFKEVPFEDLEYIFSKQEILTKLTQLFPTEY